VSETFYGRFYRLDAPPFHITPDPQLLFATQTHQHALGAVEYGIAAGKGFIVVTGEVGVGKTTILRSCLSRLDPARTKIIYLFNPNLTVANLYTSILEGLDVTLPAGSSATDAVQFLHHALLDTHALGIQVILAVDEAQNMPEETLESLRVLSNLETTKSKLLQIILVGQPELEAALRKHSLRQLAQRVAVRARIEPLTVRQCSRYVQHRIHCAGRSDDPPLFTGPALWHLARVSRGIPRTLNICCDNALINGYGYGAERITLKIAREATRALQLKSRLGRWMAPAAAALVIVAITAAAQVSFGILPVHEIGARIASWSGSAANSASASVAPQQPAPSQPAPSLPIVTVQAPPPAPPAPAAAAVAATPPASAPAAAVSFPPSAIAAPAVATPSSLPVAPAAESTFEAPPRAPDAIPPGALAEPPAMPAEARPRAVAAAATADSASGRPTPTELPGVWRVQKGDTVIKACRSTYGSCDESALRSIFTTNPRLDSKGIIRPGETILIPERDALVRPN
jgi:general secretion pathway protein A